MEERVSDAATAGRLSSELQRDVERWFIGRGVPQLVEDYSSERQMDARAAPFIGAWLVLGTVLYWGTRPDWPPLLNAGGVAATLLFTAVAFAAVRVLRRRPVLARDEAFDPWEIGLLALLPGIASGLVEGSLPEAVIATLNALLGIGAIYVVVGFGLLELAAWALERIGVQAVGIIGLLARTLPVLLILVTFLLFSQEIWEAAHAMDGGELAAVIGLLLLIGAVLVATTFRAELRAIEDRDDWENVGTEALDTPVAPLVHGMRRVPPPPRLKWLQRLNLTALALIHQLLQSAFVALLVLAFLLAFGLITIPLEVQERWVGEAVTAVWRVDLLADERTLSAELLMVSAVLSGIVGLYFTGLAVTDTAHRADFSGVVAEVRQLLSARAVYVAALRDPAAAGDAGLVRSTSPRQAVD